MGFEEIIKELLDRKRYTVQEGLEAVKQVYDDSDTEKEAIKKATDRVLKEIEEHPDMSVVDFLKMIQEEENLPTDIVIETTKQIPDIKPERLAAEAVKELDLDSPQIKEIIQEADVSLNTAQKMVSQIPDKKVKEEQQRELDKRKEQETLEQLQNIYDSCEDMNDIQLVRKISQIKISERTGKIEEKIRHIVAKRTALDYMQFGGPKIPTMAQIISPAEMLEIDFPFLVEKESQTIKNESDIDETKYHAYGAKEKWIVKMKILDNIAKNIARNFEEFGDINVPQLEQMKNLSDEELEIFVDQIKSSCKEEKLSDTEIERIKRQVRGEKSVELEDIVRIFQKMKPSDRERYLEMVKEDMQKKEEKTNQEEELEESVYTLQKQIGKLPKEEGIRIANMMSQMLREREEAREMIKNVKKIDTTQSDGDDQISI